MKSINDNVMFIHVPKTGGASITSTLEHRFNWNGIVKSKWKPLAPGMPAIRHDPLFLLESINNLNEFYIFSVVRNPYKRIYSLYTHYLSRRDLMMPILTFEMFLEYILERKNSYYHEHFLSIIPHFRYFINYTQSFFLRDSNNDIAVDKIYRFEKLNELESDFNIKLPKINTYFYKGLPTYNKLYTSKTIQLVQEIYQEDFINFNYSLEFNEAQ